MSGSATNDVWAVGVTINHFNGAMWSVQETFKSVTLGGVWVSGPSNGWAAGLSGALLQWKPNVWSPVSSGTANNLAGVWGNGMNDVWAVGQMGTIIHYD